MATKKIKLEILAIRIGEIGNEILALKDRRIVNLETCHGSIDDEFKRSNATDQIFNNCLTNAYEWVQEDREERVMSCFDEVIAMYGCANCIGAHKAKRKIGTLKQERGRIVGNISTIGKSLKGNDHGY